MTDLTTGAGSACAGARVRTARNRRSRLLVAAASVALATALGAPARAELVTVITGGTVVTPAVQPQPFYSGTGPIHMGAGGWDVVWTATSGGAVGGYNGGYGLGMSGSWLGDPAYFGTNAGDGSSVMTFTFANGYASSVGGFLNYSPLDGTMFIRVLDDQGSVLETYSPSISTASGSQNDGAFYGIRRASADIHAFEIFGGYAVLRNFTFLGELSIPPLCASLTAGADTCDITSTSVISGTADALGGSDTVRLGGAADFSFDGSTVGTNFLNFEALRKTGTSTVTLTGATTLPVYVDQGVLSVAGGISNPTGTAVILDGAGAAVSVQSGGSVSAGGTGTAVYGSASNVSVANAGTIDGYLGVYLEGSGTVGNQAGGVISADYNAVVIKGAGSVTNAGTISGGIGDGAGDYPAVYLGAGGTVTNQAGGLIEGTFGTAIGVYGGSGTVVNDGSITSLNGAGVFLDRGGSVTNTGLISSETYRAVQIQGGVGALTNSGTISAGGAYGARLYNGGTVTNQVGGSISGGVGLSGGAGVAAGDQPIDIVNSLSLVNQGTITGTTAEGVKLDAGGWVDNSGLITGVTGVRATAGATTVTNSGTITGTGGTAIALSDAADLVDLKAGSTTNGAITLAGGSDTLSIETGAALNGAASGGAGTDTLNLYGSGSASIDIGALTGFETRTKTGAGTWTLTGTDADANGWTVSGGVLQGTTDSLKGNFVDHGVLTFNQAVSGTYAGNVSGVGVVRVSGGSASTPVTFSGALTNAQGLRVTDASSVAVTGSVTSAAGSDAVQLQVSGGALDNSGTLSSGFNGVYAVNGTVTNSGTITAAKSGIFAQQGGTITNQSGGVIQGGLDGVYAQGAAATVTNAGTITGGVSNRGVWLNAGGSVTNEAGGVIQGGARGIDVQNGVGSVTNAGAIRGVSFQGVIMFSGGSVTNQTGGLIQGASDGVYMQGGTGSVTNSGTITGGAGRNGVFLNAGGSVTNNAGGAIGGDWRGVVVQNGAGTVTNAGEIHATVDNGVSVFAGGTVTNQAGGTITAGWTTGGWGVLGTGAQTTVTNAGAISGEEGVVFVTAAGSVDNQAGGTITGRLAGVDSWSGGLTLTNSGVITGDTGVVTANGAANVSSYGAITGSGGTAMNLAGAFDHLVALHAGSTTNGNVLTAEGSDTIALSGALNGSLFTGAAHDLVTVYSGAAITGTLDGGDGDDALTFAGAGDAAFDAGAVFNFEQLTKVGSGVLTLTGIATSDAGWSVQEGTLRVSGGAIGDGATVDVGVGATLAVASSERIGSLTGAGSVTLNQSSLLTGTDADSTFAGVISGEGDLWKLGSGALTLSGASTFTGYAVVDAGTLRLGAAERLADDTIVQVNAGGTFDLQAFSETVDAALIFGTLDGTGTLNASEYDLDSATVNANLGSGSLYGVGGLSILNGTTGQVSANLLAGTLRLGGDERFSDASTVSLNGGAALDLAGHTETLARLFGTGSVHLGEGGRLNLGFGDADSAFGGVIDGAGSLHKIGGGTLTLGGLNTFSGSTFVDGGTLNLLGRLNGGVTVNTGGTLSGFGEVGGTLTLNGGVLTPGGTELGVLTVGGFTSQSGTFVVDVTGAAGGFTSDGLNVIGTAVLNGATVQARLHGADFGFDQQYLILDSASLSGSFANGTGFTPTQGDPTLLTRLRYDVVPGGVVLELRRLMDWTDGAAPGNPTGLGEALNGTQQGASDQWAGTLNLLAGLSPEERARAFETMAGEGAASGPSAAQLVGDRFAAVLQSHMGGGGGGGTSMPTAFAGLALNGSHGGQVQSLLSGDGGLYAAGRGGPAGAESWVEVYAIDSKLKGRGGAADVGTGGGGVAAGWDAPLGKHGRIGGAFGFSRADADAVGLDSTTRGEFWHVGSYAAWTLGDWRLGLSGAHMRGDVTTLRLITLGAGGVQAEGDTHISSTTLSAEAARRFELGGGFDLTALGRATGTDLHQDGYVERGAGTLSLSVGDVDRQMLFGQVGVKLERVFEKDGSSLTPYVGAGVAGAAGDRQGQVGVAFTGAPSGTGAFSVQGAELPPSWAEVSAGVQMRSGEGFVVKAGYDGVLSDRLKENRFAVRVGWRW